MNITTGQLTTVTLTMTEPEAREFLVDAQAIQAQVRDALAEVHHLNGNAVTISAKPKSSPRKQGKKSPLARVKAMRDAKMLYECTVRGCEKSFPTERGRNLHVTRIHSGWETPVPAVDSEQL